LLAVKRVLAGAAVTVTGVALRFAAKGVVACLLLRREFGRAREHRVELRGKRRYLRGSLIAGDGLRHLIEGGADPAAIKRTKMNWHRIAVGRRPGPGADLLHVTRPCDDKRLRSPHAFEHRAIGPLRSAIGDAAAAVRLLPTLKAARRAGRWPEGAHAGIRVDPPPLIRGASCHHWRREPAVRLLPRHVVSEARKHGDERLVNAA
jgi:hypothetical protein